ncbi:class IV adenylate cyclase [Candidatus Pacearchaeota archaeon]|nr:hypothetical protein [uncultured archaeon]MBS3091523.1 class IV adenylate cyclase [Candidatus Pacearchaeota archaeon]
MSHLNVEFKARCHNLGQIRDILTIAYNANFHGLDHQIDTYFKPPNGRLKLREGNVENNLIYYERENKQGPKQSLVTLFDTQSANVRDLKEILTKSIGVLAVVDKIREIYFVDNVKFHLDQVKSLGNFVEVEALDKKGDIGREFLIRQCADFLKEFQIQEKDLISISYSNMLLELSKK